MIQADGDQIVGPPDSITHIIDGISMHGVLDGGENPVVIEGQFKGEITGVSDLTLSEVGFIDGQVRADTVTISGKFKGNLECESLTITETGIVEGDVRTNALSIDLGAEVVGSISRV